MSVLPLVAFPLDSEGVCAVVTTRHGGVSTGVYDSLNLGDHVGDDPALVRRNRDMLAFEIGVEALTVPDQQHLASCAVVTSETAGKGHAGVAESVATFPATDALVTNTPGTALAIMVADCAPVVFHDPVNGAIGAAHCGRGGLMRGILSTTVETMRSTFGTDPGDLLIGVGPCISFDSYEVGTAEADALDELFPRAGFTRPGRPGHAYLDLAGAVLRQLADLGIRDGNLHRIGVDTLTGTSTYFSDRAQRPCGRFMAIIALTSRGS